MPIKVNVYAEMNCERMAVVISYQSNYFQLKNGPYKINHAGVSC